jgi:hypothetical protein
MGVFDMMGVFELREDRVDVGYCVIRWVGGGRWKWRKQEQLLI